jgi:hypothetical protein
MKNLRFVFLRTIVIITMVIAYGNPVDNGIGNLQ